MTQKYFLYGREKIGKSTFASQFESPIFLRTEDGLTALTTYNVPIDSWQRFLEACSELSEGRHPFRTVVVDIVDNLYSFCQGHVLAKYGVQHESDLDWGKGWSVVSGEFERAVSKLSLQGMGLILISHAETATIKPKNAPEYTRIVPTLSKSARKFVMGLADHIVYMAVDKTEEGNPRKLYCQPTELFEAGSRWPLAAEIALPADPADDYGAFKAAYDEAIALQVGGAA